MISHLLRKSNGHLLRKSNGHLIYRARLSGNYIENCHATYTREYIEGKGYQNTYTIYDVPLNAVGQYPCRRLRRQGVFQDRCWQLL